MTHLNLIAACLLLATNAFAAEPAAPSTKPIDGILVTVADEIILISDLQRAVRATSNGQSAMDAGGKITGGPLSPDDGEKILDQLINQKVLTLKARELALQVTDDELNAEIEGFLKQQNLTQEKLDEILASEGTTRENYREEFRRNMESQRLIGRTIRPNVSVTDDDVRSFYLQQPGVAEKQQRVRLASLVIDPSKASTPEQKADRMQKIDKVEKEVRSNETMDNAAFAQLVKLYSEDPEAALKGGALPPKELKELPKELREKLSLETKPNTVVGPITIGTSVFFFQFLGISLGNESEFEKQKQQWKNTLLETKGNERLAEYVKAERSKTKIERRKFTIVK